MTAGVLAHQAVLVVAVAGLGGAGLRVASRIGETGLVRVLVAFTLACAAAVCESLGLGLVALGGSSVALGAAAVATWALASLAVARPAIPVSREFVAWLGGVGRWTQATIPAVAGLVVAWIVWQLRHPLVGGDGLIYHLPIASAWVQNGRPGSVVNVLDGLSVANYPVTNEVLVSWALGISRSWVVASTWSVLLLVVLGGASWATLRSLAIPRRERALAVVALCVMPVVVAQLCGPDTDIAALTWLAVSAALASAARERPRLIYVALIAAGLCFGTKTTPAILLIGLGVMARRPLAAALRTERVWLLASVAVAVVVGGIWSVRDLIVHGSPFWPLEAAPWGTPVPASLVPLRPSFLSQPRSLISNHGSEYLSTLAGGLLLLAGGLGAAAVRRSRPARAVGGLAAVALLIWAASPYTGIEAGAYAAGATRYLLPALAASTLALVLSTRGADRRLRFAIDALLVVSIAFSALKTAELGSQFVPGPPTLVAGVVVGIAVGLLAAGVLAGGAGRPVHRASGLAMPAVAVVLAAGSAVGLAIAGDGYVARHARTPELDSRVLEAAIPGLGAGSRPIAAGPATVVMLRGDHLDHALSVLDGGETCGSLRARLAHETVVLQGEPVTPLYTRLSACLRGVPREFSSQYVDVYG
jgi:hypothetical protein